MSEVTLEVFAAALADGATLLDVREPGEYIGDEVPGALLMPMGQLPSRTSELDRARPVYVICATGGRSGAMSDHLRHGGFNALSVAGGTVACSNAGGSVLTGTRPTA